MVLTGAPSLGVLTHFFKSYSVSSQIAELPEVLKHKLLKLLKNLSRAEIQIHKGTFEILEDYKNYQEKERDLYKARLNLSYYLKVFKKKCYFICKITCWCVTRIVLIKKRGEISFIYH